MTRMISSTEMDYIKDNYTFYKNDGDYEMPPECRKHNDWQKVYREGCDSKYGTVMVSHSMTVLASS